MDKLETCAPFGTNATSWKHSQASISGWALPTLPQQRTCTPRWQCWLLLLDRLGSLSFSRPLFIRPALTPQGHSHAISAPTSHVTLPGGSARRAVLALASSQRHPVLSAAADLHTFSCSGGLFAGLSCTCSSDLVKTRTLFYFILILFLGCASLSADELCF